jgi:hypothetical protein
MYPLIFLLLNIQPCSVALLPIPVKERHMPRTLEQIKGQLSAIEPDDGIYDGIGPSEIPLLDQLVQHSEGWMASRAVFALSRIPDSRSVAVLSRVAADPRQEVRVAVAASMKNLNPKDADGILIRLLTDSELGVQKFAILAVSGAHDAAVHAKLKDIQTRDPSPLIREVAKSKLLELNLIQP